VARHQANLLARFATQRHALLRAVENLAHARANQGRVSNFGLTTTNSQWVTNRLTTNVRFWLFHHP
jgi:hypothetical protein